MEVKRSELLHSSLVNSYVKIEEIQQGLQLLYAIPIQRIDPICIIPEQYQHEFYLKNEKFSLLF